jgi:hypothetical protein
VSNKIQIYKYFLKHPKRKFFLMNNPLAQSRHRTMAVQAPIVGKVFPDTCEIEKREYEAKDNAHTGKVVPGGDKNVNFSCMPGEICLSRVYDGGSGHMDSRYEVGLTSAAGLYQDKSSEAIHREHRFVGGVGENGYEHGGDGMYGTDPLEHGYAVIRSGGPFTTHNWTNEPIYAGQILEFKIPLPEYKKGEERPIVDTGNNVISLSIRSGTPLQKPVYYLQPCDPSSFEASLEGIKWCIENDSSAGGVKNLKKKDYDTKYNQLTNLQIEALELKLGLQLMTVFTLNVAEAQEKIVKETLKDAKESEEGWLSTFLDWVGIYDPWGAKDDATKSKVGIPKDSSVELDVVDYLFKVLNNPKDDKFNKELLPLMLPMLGRSFTGQLRARMNRVVGVALSNARPGETLDVLLRPSY